MSARHAHFSTQANYQHGGLILIRSVILTQVLHQHDAQSHVSVWETVKEDRSHHNTDAEGSG